MNTSSLSNHPVAANPAMTFLGHAVARLSLVADRNRSALLSMHKTQTQ